MFWKCTDGKVCTGLKVKGFELKGEHFKFNTFFVDGRREKAQKWLGLNNVSQGSIIYGSISRENLPNPKRKAVQIFLRAKIGKVV